LLATHPALGLALLAVAPDRELPHVRLGDSDAVAEGQRLAVFGWSERGRAGTSALKISASRSDERGLTRLFELSGQLRAGGEGGALVDEDGYAIAVARRGDGTGASIGVAINAVKDFLADHGLAGELPRRLWLGPIESLEDKGLRLRLVDGVRDSWPGRTRVESPPDFEGLSLRIDRLASSMELGSLESRLLAGGFGDPPTVRADDGTNGKRQIRRSLTRVYGSARAERDGWPYAVEYVVMRIGEERIVARYELPEEQAAYNRSVLRKSLESLEVSRFLMLPVSRPLEVTWEPARLAVADTPGLVLPQGWRQEPALEPVPAGLPQPDDGILASPEHDYTVVFGAYYWKDGSLSGDAAGDRRTAELHRELYGEAYRSRFTFVPVGEATLLLECRAPTSKELFVGEACEEWTSAVVARVTGRRTPAR
jgi:hypothetical protein